MLEHDYHEVQNHLPQSNKKHWKYTIIPCHDQFKIAHRLLIMFLNNQMDIGTSIKVIKHDYHFQ